MYPKNGSSPSEEPPVVVEPEHEQTVGDPPKDAPTSKE